jgi:hypothetical protein
MPSVPSIGPEVSQLLRYAQVNAAGATGYKGHFACQEAGHKSFTH